MDDFEKNYNLVLRFLSFRPRSEKEVMDYLKKKKVDLSIVQKIIGKLKEHRFINDEEFTRIWVQQRTKIKPRALRVIKRELIEKGIEKEKIEELLTSCENEIPSDFQKAFALAQKRVRKFKNLDKNKFFEKMGRFLASKGFNYDIIKDVIKQLQNKEID